MTMSTETETHRQDSRNKGAVLCKQSEIEEMDEHEHGQLDTSPGSDQSDATITAEEREHQSGKEVCEVKVTESYQNEQCRAEVRVSDLSSSTSPTNHIQQVPQKVKQLQRSKAFEESPPPEQQNLYLQANGLSQKSLSHDRLSKSGSQSSEAGSSCFSRDSSFDKSPYKDSTGINLEDFIHKTINKSPKDRTMLLKLETDLINFVNEPKHHYLKFPPMSSYDRMLVHRIAAFFGLDHNVDQTGKSVIVNKTSNTRIPEFSFKEHIDNMEMGDRKSGPIKVMKRGGLSLEDRESYSKNLEKPMLANTKARSFEERKKQYDRVRSKIFNSCEEPPVPYSEEEASSIMPNIIKKPQRPSSLSKNSDGLPWSSTDSSGYGTDCSSKSRGIPKANSFGGVTHNHVKAPLKSQSLCKTDSISSGTQSPNMAHHVAAPTPPGSRSDSSPLSRSSSTGPIQSPHSAVFMTGQNQQVLWVSSDYRNIPPGSVVINPQTGQPYTNPDGSIYTYNPNQPPPVTHQQQTMYALPQQQPPQEMWNPNPESMVGAEQVCRHLSGMSLSQQSSTDSVGEPPGLGMMQAGQFVIGGQPQVPPQGYQQQNAMGQPQFFQGQNVAGQANVRCTYPVSYQVIGQGQGSQMQVATDNQNQNIGQQQQPQFVTQYGPSYSSVPMPSAQSIENYPSFSSQTTYPIPQSDHVQNFPSSFPISYSQSNFVPNPSQVFYPSVPCSQAVGGFTYGTNQGPYQTGTTPPSQQPQPTSANISVQQVPGQQMNVPQQVVPAVQTPSTPQFNSLYPTMQQCQGQPQFRQSSPQVLQIPGVQQQHNLNLNPVGLNQNFPSVLRNMQINMPMTGPTGPHQAFIPQSGPVTVSAKGISLDNPMPKAEAGGDGKEYILGGVGSFSAPMVAGPPRPVGQILRPPTQITADLRLIGQPTLRAPLQTIQLHPSSNPQQPKPRVVNNVPKPQRLSKSHSKDGSENSQSFDGETPSTGDTLEVYDLPSTMQRSEVEAVLHDLVITRGGQIQFFPKDSVNQPTSSASSTVSSYQKILAVFPSDNCATQVYQQYSASVTTSSLFKLRYQCDSR